MQIQQQPRTWVGHAMKAMDPQFSTNTRDALWYNKKELTSNGLEILLGVGGTAVYPYSFVVGGYYALFPEGRTVEERRESAIFGLALFGAPITAVVGLVRGVKNLADAAVYSVANTLGYDEL